MFKIGDRVLVTKQFGLLFPGDTGVVVAVGGYIGVRFDRWNSSFHTCQGACDPGHGYYLHDCKTYLSLIDDENLNGDDWI